MREFLTVFNRKEEYEIYKCIEEFGLILKKLKLKFQ